MFAALLFGALEAGKTQMQLDTDVPLDLVLVLRALIVLFIAAPMLTRMIWRIKAERRRRSASASGGGARDRDPAPPPRRHGAAGRRARSPSAAASRNLGIGYLVLAVVAAVFFTGHDGTATFNLDGGRSFGLAGADRRRGSPWRCSPCSPASSSCRGFGKLTNAVLAVVAVTLLMSFLAWAAAGSSFSFIGVLVVDGRLLDADHLRRDGRDHLRALRASSTSPSRGCCSTARSWPSFVGSVTTFWVGVLAAMVTSALLAWLLAWLAIRFKVDQVIVGFFINFFVLGLTNFLSKRLLTEHQNWNYVATQKPFEDPGAAAASRCSGRSCSSRRSTSTSRSRSSSLLTWLLFRTRWGLRTRSRRRAPAGRRHARGSTCSGCATAT